MRPGRRLWLVNMMRWDWGEEQLLVADVAWLSQVWGVLTQLSA